MSFNQFSGAVPIYLLNKNDLEQVYLNSNQFVGIIPDSICDNIANKILIYGNLLCPPYPECIKYVGEQECKN